MNFKKSTAIWHGIKPTENDERANQVVPSFVVNIKIILLEITHESAFSKCS